CSFLSHNSLVVYEAEGYDSRGTRSFDASSGYRSRTMLVVPMRDHVSVTMRLLDQIPFPNKLKGVPRYAGGHHEKLNGKGYPPGPDGRRFAPADADAGHCRRVRSAHRRRPRSEEHTSELQSRENLVCRLLP